MRALGGGEKTGKNPVDRGRCGCKHHIATGVTGVPISMRIGPANEHDSRMLIPLVDDATDMLLSSGCDRPLMVFADKAYDSRALREAVKSRQMIPMLPRRGSDEDRGIGKVRWVVERSFAWLHSFRRLRVRYERLAMMHEAMLKLGCILVAYRVLNWSL